MVERTSTRRRSPSERKRTQGSQRRREERVTIAIEQHGRCHWCECVVFEGLGGDDDATIDHIIPLSKSGTNKRDNKVVACRWCNERRADSVPRLGDRGAQNVGASMSEFGLQKTVVGMLTLLASRDVLWFAVPNGEARSLRTGAKLKAMGVKRGVADLCIITPGGHVHFLELKSAKGRLSEVQKDFQMMCALIETPYAVASSPEEAARILSDWGAIRSIAAIPSVQWRAA